MEVLGHEPEKAYGTIHYCNPHREQQGTYILDGTTFAEDYHVFSVEWEPSEIRFYIDGNLYYQATETERTVGLETIIPTIYRAYIENYKIVFQGLNEPIYTLKLSGDTKIAKYTIDLETKTTTDGIQINNVALANDEQKSEFLCGILYKDFSKSGSEENFKKKYNVDLPTNSLINRLKGTKITEYLGVYYQNDNENVPDVNKTEKRIITYKIEKQ